MWTCMQISHRVHVAMTADTFSCLIATHLWQHLEPKFEITLDLCGFFFFLFTFWALWELTRAGADVTGAVKRGCCFWSICCG